MIRSLTILALLTFAPAAHAAQQIVNDTELAFTLTLPEGFEPAPRFVGQKDIAHAFEFGEPDDQGIRVILFIERMRGTLGRDKLTAEDVPAGGKGKLLAAKWDNFDVQGFEVHEQIGGAEYITYNIQIPLKPEAIQLKLFAAATRRAELDQLLPPILAGLQGQSNWLRSAASPALDNSKPYAVGLLALGAVCVILGVSFIVFVSRRNRLLGLCLAVAFYLTSWAIAGSRVREIVLFTGVIRMIGFIGGVIAIVLVFVPRRPKPLPAPTLNQTSPPSASP